jgi:hypothetical protein
LFVLAFVVAGAAVVALPSGLGEAGSVVALTLALLVTVAIRAAFLKPLFLISMLIRFHALIEGQPLNMQWAHYLDGLTPDFSKGTQVAGDLVVETTDARR